MLEFFHLQRLGVTQSFFFVKVLSKFDFGHFLEAPPGHPTLNEKILVWDISVYAPSPKVRFKVSGGIC